MDFALNEQQRAIQESAHKFACHELAPNAAHWDSTETFPIETIKRAGEIGFCGLYTPETLGGKINGASATHMR